MTISKMVDHWFEWHASIASANQAFRATAGFVVTM